MKHLRLNFAIACLAVTALGGVLTADDSHDHAEKHSHDDAPAAKAGELENHDKHSHEGEHSDEVTLSEQAINQYNIQIGTARKQAILGAVVSPARVVFNADAMAHVGSAVTGRIAELRVKLGDSVKKGDVLAVVDSPELGEAQSEFLLKRAAVETARPSVQLAKDAFARAKQLHEGTQSIAVSELQRREAELRTAEGSLRAAEAAATAAENKLHLYGMSQAAIAKLLSSGEIEPQYSIFAPIDGQVIEREVTLGELVRPDREALMIVADLSTTWVIADVPETRLGRIAIGSSTQIRTAAGGQTIAGTVTYIAPALDSTTRSAKVRIEVHEGHEALRPGMFVQATIMPRQSADAVLVVPSDAVQTVAGGPAVFVPVKGEPNTFAKRSIRVGAAVAGMVPVTDGLAEGEPLVVSGSFILKAELGKSGAAHEH